MNLIKNLFWLIIAVFIVYLMLIFFKPDIASQIAKSLKIEKFNEQVLMFKDKLDYVSTKMPSKEEIETAYSWAKDKIWDIKDWIDTVRETAWDIEETYNETKDFINETWEKIDKVKETLNDIEKVWETISDVVNKDVMK